MRLRFLLPVLAALATAACGGPSDSRRPPEAGPPLRVSVEAVREGASRKEAEIAAGLEPWRRATPGTVLMGRVIEIRHREGDRVKAGETLARVDNRDVDARRAQAEAGLAAARAQEQNAAHMRERMERLFHRQAASQKSVDDAIAGDLAARAQAAAAEEGVAAARALADYASVVAPFAGTVTERRTELGDIAAPGTPLFVVEDLSKMKVEARVAESALAGLSVGSVVAVSIPAAGPAALPGTLAEILPSADPASRTFLVRVILENQAGALRSGMFARIGLPSAEAKALEVPESAVVRRGPLSGVFVVDAEGIARLRYVTLGSTTGGRIEVLTGLVPDEKIVVAPPPMLEDGRRVEVDG